MFEIIVSDGCMVRDRVDRYFVAGQGYMELGMFEDARAEMDAGAVVAREEFAKQDPGIIAAAKRFWAENSLADVMAWNAPKPEAPL